MAKEEVGAVATAGCNFVVSPASCISRKSVHMPILGSLDRPGGMQGLEAGTGATVSALIISLGRKGLP